METNTSLTTENELIDWLKNNNVFHPEWDKKICELNIINAHYYGIESLRNIRSKLFQSTGIEPCSIWNINSYD